LETFVHRQGLIPVRLLNTHCHIDHILGNAFVAETYGLHLCAHPGETPVLEAAERVSQMYGLPAYRTSPPIGQPLAHDETLLLANIHWKVLLVPGHSPASVALYSSAFGLVIGGDVLFRGSIGRTDLPGGSMATLLHSIHTQLLCLPDDTRVLPGHGGSTTIGYERQHNPFLQSQAT
jgi:glyoxylase-like metal-dependent hydrolase (beta-lactamase superfamily II)